MLCKTCSKRNVCKVLCPEAEKWVNQDYVNLKETTLSSINLDIENVVVDSIVEIQPLDVKDWSYITNNVDLSKLQKKYIYLYYWKNITYKKIGKRYNTSRQNVTSIIERGKIKIMKLLIKNCLSV